MLAAMILGASAVQVGSRFVVSKEASCHINFKNAVILAGEGDTELSLKKLTPVRLLKNNFYREVKSAQNQNASVENLSMLLDKRRAKKGMFEADLQEGELEIGQACAQLKTIQCASVIVNEIWEECNMLLRSFPK